MPGPQTHEIRTSLRSCRPLLSYENLVDFVLADGYLAIDGATGDRMRTQRTHGLSEAGAAAAIGMLPPRDADNRERYFEAGRVGTMHWMIPDLVAKLWDGAVPSIPAEMLFASPLAARFYQGPAGCVDAWRVFGTLPDSKK